MREPSGAAGEEAGAQRPPRDHAEAGRAAERQQVELGRALHERVLRLQRDERRPALAVLQSNGPRQQPRREVRRAERALLAGAYQPVERLERLLERDVGVGRVHLVEVDHLDAEAPQRGVARRPHAVGRQSLPRRVGHLAADLRGDHDLVAPARQPRRERALGLAVAVHVGGVDECPARLHEAIEHPLRVLRGRLAAHMHGPEA
jgi:hypothetical protein